MPARHTTPIGAPCWVDLMTSDTGRARDFYCRLFDWTAEDPASQFGGYFNFTKDGVRVAGCMAAQGSAGPTDVWSVYLTSDDTRKTLEAAEANGGQVIAPAMEVGDLGVMGVLVDNGGAVIGVWQPGQHTGFGIVGEPGAPSWFELHTRAYDEALGFYRDVFRWETEAEAGTEGFRYSTLTVDGEQLAGVMDDNAFGPDYTLPAHWAVYFGAADADATLATVVELGGSIVTPAEDTPYGRLAEATDPLGGHFKLVAANAAMPAKES